MKELLEDIGRWRSAGKQVALARVVGTDGSGPRDPGAAMAVNDDSFLYQGDYYPDPERDADYSAEYHGARRLAGLPTSLVLSVGVEPARLSTLATALEAVSYTHLTLPTILLV